MTDTPANPPVRPTHAITIGTVRRELPLFAVAPGVTIAILNILGDVELVAAAAHGLADRLKDLTFDTLLTAEAKSIPLAHVLAAVMNKPYVVLRKTYKPYMGEAISAETHSITTGTVQTLFLDGKDRPLIAGRRVVILDDVISTGSTLQAMRAVIAAAQGIVTAEAAILTEGDAAQWAGVIALGHLPVFTAHNESSASH